MVRVRQSQKWEKIAKMLSYIYCFNYYERLRLGKTTQGGWSTITLTLQTIRHSVV